MRFTAVDSASESALMRWIQIMRDFSHKYRGLDLNQRSPGYEPDEMTLLLYPDKNQCLRLPL